jgi:hypothetical protein
MGQTPFEKVGEGVPAEAEAAPLASTAASTIRAIHTQRICSRIRNINLRYTRGGHLENHLLSIRSAGTPASQASNIERMRHFTDHRPHFRNDWGQDG